MKVEVGQLWMWRGTQNLFVVTSYYEPVKAVDIMDQYGFVEEGVDFNYAVRDDAKLVSTHPDMYAAVAEMGRLVKGGAV